jgi:hypothetical protein
MSVDRKRPPGVLLRESEGKQSDWPQKYHTLWNSLLLHFLGYFIGYWIHGQLFEREKNTITVSENTIHALDS